MKKIIDERIIGLKKKYGFEALFLASLLMFIDFMVRIVFLKKGFWESIDLYFVMVIPWVYYSVRGLLGGIYINRSKQEKITGKIFGVTFASVFLLVALIGLSNDGVLNRYSNLAFFSGVATGLIFVAVAAAVLTTIMKKQQKEIEED